MLFSTKPKPIVIYKILWIFIFSLLFFSCSRKLTGLSWYDKDKFVVTSNHHTTSYKGYKAVRFLSERGDIRIDSVRVVSDRGTKDYTFHPGSLSGGDTSRTYRFPFILAYSERLEIYCRYKEQTLLGKVLHTKAPESVSLVVLAYYK